MIWLFVGEMLSVRKRCFYALRFLVKQVLKVTLGTKWDAGNNILTGDQLNVDIYGQLRL